MPGAAKKLLSTSGEDGFTVGFLFVEGKFWSGKLPGRDRTTFSY